MQSCWRRFRKVKTFTRELPASYLALEPTQNLKKRADSPRLLILQSPTLLNPGVYLNVSESVVRKQRKSSRITTTLTRAFVVIWTKFQFELVNTGMCVQSMGVSVRYLASLIEMPTSDELPGVKP